MQTDQWPTDKAERDEYQRSAHLLFQSHGLPAQAPLLALAQELQATLPTEDKKAIQDLSNQISRIVCDHFSIKPAPIRILGTRKRQDRGEYYDELFGDYDFASTKIRLWMRTAVQEKMTSYGTFLSTLCHELCHHIDVKKLELPNTFHTQGFYERSGLLYHHVRGTPMKKLVWNEHRDGTKSINWPKTMGNKS
ncbi:MAG: hypothetical protein J0H83_19065 [Candidatus Melainabacteria bacterium]|nr:hypothetical protein [Candidatus Melainabacteria bacterium]MBX9672928.1 hypothetical protein [Candidatus Obscuribacterales bacterium]